MDEFDWKADVAERAEQELQQALEDHWVLVKQRHELDGQIRKLSEALDRLSTEAENAKARLSA